MVNAEQVARYLLHLAHRDKEPVLLTHLHLQKLVYYVQGWTLGISGEPMFHETLQAWQHGPVSPRVYRTFKGFQARSIPTNQTRCDPALLPKHRTMIEFVYSMYGRFSASELRRRTHREPPWRKARGTLPESVSSRTPISTQDMITFFAEEYRKHMQRNGIDLDELRRSELEAIKGPYYTLDLKTGDVRESDRHAHTRRA